MNNQNNQNNETAQNGANENTTAQGQQDQQQGGEAGKVAKRFDGAVSKLTAMLQGNKSLFKKPKVPNDALTGLVEELLKERKEKALADFKGKAIALIDKKVAFDKFLQEAEKKFQEEVTKQKKAFAEEADQVFALLEDVNKMEADYRASLSTL